MSGPRSPDEPFLQPPPLADEVPAPTEGGAVDDQQSSAAAQPREEIAKAEVVKKEKSEKKAKTDKHSKSAKADAAEAVEKPAKVEKAAKKEKSDKTEKAPTDEKTKKDKSDKKEKKDKKVKVVEEVDVPQPEDFEANRERIEALCSTPPNNYCTDCNQAGTRWASANHGVFLCIRCSGIHRSLGVHISKVKSTNMDRWTRGEVELMQKIGNRRGKELYEARLPKGVKPLTGTESDSTIKAFIVAKYETKAYAVENIAEILRKAVKAASSHQRGPSSPTHREDPMVGLFGTSLERKKRKANDGPFGAVTALPEEHDAHRRQLFAAFCVNE